MIFKKKLLILFSAVFIVLILFAVYYVPKWRFKNCLSNFNLEKLDITKQKVWFNEELGYMMINSVVMDAFLNGGSTKCLLFKDKQVANSLFYSEICSSKLQNVEMLYGFAEKLKAKMAEQEFLDECQSFLFNQMADFKKEVPEKLRDERSKAFCQSVYLSYQKGAIILNDAFIKDSINPNPPTCDCFDAEGKQRVCQHEFCRTMGFFAAVSKNDQSLCPKLSEVEVLPYCNLYFSKETVKEYNDIFKQSYCHKK